MTAALDSFCRPARRSGEQTNTHWSNRRNHPEDCSQTRNRVWLQRCDGVRRAGYPGFVVSRWYPCFWTARTTLSPLRRGFYALPGRVGVVLAHGAGEFGGVGTQVLFVDATLLVDDESHYAGIAPLGWIRHESVAGDHVPVDDVAVFAAGCVRSLAHEDLQVVAVIRSMLQRGKYFFSAALACSVGSLFAGHVPFGATSGNKRAQRAGLVAFRSLPIQPVVFATGANEMLR